MKMTNQINTTINRNMPVKAVQLLKRLGVAAAMLGLFSASTYGQIRTITLNEAITLGIQNSKNLKLSQSKIDQAVSEFNQAKDRSLPSGSVSFGYSRAEIPVNTLAFGSSDIHLPKSANANLGIASVNELIWGGNKLKYARESTDLLIQAARLDAENDKDQITYNIVSEYYNLYKVLQSQKVVQQNLATIDQQIHQSQRFFEQGLVTKNDVLRFQLQRANIELNGVDLETNRKVINYNLNILLGLPETTQLNIEQINEPAREPAPLTTYLDSALATRQEIKSLDIRTRVAETNIKSTRANTLPSLSASASAYYLDVSANPLPTHGNYITPLTLGLNLSWNFGTLWNNKNKVSEAKIQRDQVVINRSITVDNIKNEVNQSYQNYVSALNRVNLLQTSIAQATENNRLQESRYQSNIVSATERADAETLLYQAQINLELAKADAGLAYYNLLKSTGKLNK